MPKNNVDVSQADIDDMRQRVSKLEQELKSLESFISKPSPVPVASLPSRVKYVKDLNSGYFMTLLSYKGEGCIFKVELKSETEGLFTLLSLDKLKTVNGLTDFVECLGNCKLEDAQNHEVKEMGTCKLKEKDGVSGKTRLVRVPPRRQQKRKARSSMSGILCSFAS